MFGLVAFVVAAIRRRASGVGAIVMPGVWTIIYGSQAFNYNTLLLALEPSLDGGGRPLHARGVRPLASMVEKDSIGQCR